MNLLNKIKEYGTTFCRLEKEIFFDGINYAKKGFNAAKPYISTFLKLEREIFCEDLPAYARAYKRQVGYACFAGAILFSSCNLFRSKKADQEKPGDGQIAAVQTIEADASETNAQSPSLEEAVEEDADSVSEEGRTKELKKEVEDLGEKHEEYLIKRGDTLCRITRKKNQDYTAKQIIYFVNNFFGPVNGKESMEEYPFTPGQKYDFSRPADELRKDPNYIVAGKILKFPIDVQISYNKLPKRFQNKLGGDESTKYVVAARADNNEVLIVNLDNGRGASVDKYIAELEERI